MALVTLAQVNGALRLDLQGTAPEFTADSRTADILLKIDQAEDIILDYLKTTAAEEEWTAETVPGRVSAAIILTVDCLLDDSDEKLAMLSGISGHEPYDPRNPIAALLKRTRDPAMA